MEEGHGLFIGGRVVPPSSESYADVIDPATNRPLAKVAAGTRADVDAAVEAARLAFESPEWRGPGPEQARPPAVAPRPTGPRPFRRARATRGDERRQAAPGSEETSRTCTSC